MENNNQKSNALRDWQGKALSYFIKHHTCLIQAATGTGKTRLALSILDHIYNLPSIMDHPLKTLIVVPKNVILDNWFKVLTKHFSIRKIGLFYGDIKEPADITITNMQSIDKLNIEDYDVLILDEIHQYYSDRMLQYIKQPMLYKVGLTATLNRRDSKHWEVLEIFGFNLFNYTLEQGVNDKVLSDYNFHNVAIRLTTPEQEKYEFIANRIAQIEFSRHSMSFIGVPESKAQKYAIYDERKKILCNSPEKISVLDKLMPLLEGKKVIIFNEYNAISNSLFWKLTGLGRRPCIFNTGISKKVRLQNLDDYAKDKYDIIITTKALDEGYDLTHIDAAIILSGGTASRQMIQRAGRVLRKTENTKDIYQVYFTDTIEEEIALKRYELVKDSCKMYEVLSLSMRDDINGR